MKTYQLGCKCSSIDMEMIVQERNEIETGRRRLHSPAVNSIIRREIKRYFEKNFNSWEHDGWIVDTLQNDLGFTEVQVKTQLKNLAKYILLKKFCYKEGTRQILSTMYRVNKKVRIGG